EELLNRIPERNILILRPLSPENLKKIAGLGLEGLRKKLLPDSELFQSVDLKWTDRVPEFIQSYQYEPEDNARPVLARVLSSVEEPLLKAIREEQIKASGQRLVLEVDIETNSDHTRGLVMNIQEPNGTTRQVKQLITETLRERP